MEDLAHSPQVGRQMPELHTDPTLLIVYHESWSSFIIRLFGLVNISTLGFSCNQITVPGPRTRELQSVESGGK